MWCLWHLCVRMYSLTRSEPFPSSLILVVDHRRHHPLEFEQVEARVVKVAEVAAQAMYFRVSPSLHHQQVMELEAILAVVQEELAVHDVQEVTEVNRVQKGTSRSSKKVKFGGDGSLISDILKWNQLGLTSCHAEGSIGSGTFL